MEAELRQILQLFYLSVRHFTKVTQSSFSVKLVVYFIL